MAETMSEETPLLGNPASPAVSNVANFDALLAAATKQNEQRSPPLFDCAERRRHKRLRKFYADQQALIEQYTEDSELLVKHKRLMADGGAGDTSADASAYKQRRVDEMLAVTTLLVNVVLLCAKLVAAYLSNSLSIISTVIDSAVDITSGAVIWLTVRFIDNHNPYEYPRGRNKLEPIAVIIVSIVMGAANLVMIIQAVQSIINKTIDPVVDIPTLAILASGTAIKVVLLVICLRQKSSSSKVLAMDQRNDIITNIVATTCAVIGHRFWLYADPIGAILVCSFIAGSWFWMAAGMVPLLSGKSASSHFTNRIIRVATNHDDRIICLDTVLVYHYGHKFLVELHVVLSANMTLKESHDITEPLQIKLERLPYVERAFVHCDYAIDGFQK